MRRTLFIVTTPRDEELMRLAGTAARYAWRGVRTVKVVAGSESSAGERKVMERAAMLLGIEQTFQWSFQQGEEQVGAQRLARTLRAFQPQVVLTTSAARAFCQAGWHIAADAGVLMPGLQVLDISRCTLWQPGNGMARIPVPLTAGIRHALSCLFAVGQFTMMAWRARALEQPWAAEEYFEQIAGAPCTTEIGNFFHPRTSADSYCDAG